MRRLRLVVFVVGAAAGAGLWGCSADDPTSGDQTTTLSSGGVALVYPGTWQDASELGLLVLRHANARIVITAEPRRTHTAAIARLDSIGDERLEPAQSFKADGWPALQRRYVAIAPIPSSAVRQGLPQLLTHVTTAVAVDRYLLRIEATIFPPASPALIAEVEQISRSVRVDAGATRFWRLLALEEPIMPRSGPNLTRILRQPPLVPRHEAPQEILLENDAEEGAQLRTNNSGGIDSEIEVAVSNDGQRVIIANNTRDYQISTNYGISFNSLFDNAGSGVDQGDPSLAVGASGTFYTAHIRQPNGTAAAGNVSGCGDQIDALVPPSTTFVLRGYAGLSAPTVTAMTGVTFPDQEHIGADRVTLSGSSQDQVYSVWRDFSPQAPVMGDTCGGFFTDAAGNSRPVNLIQRITCSTDGGATWPTTRAMNSAGDFPRVGVGQDGFVYAVYVQSGNVVIDKFSSCANGLARQTGFPVTVGAAGVNCSNTPVPAGLDRCNGNNVLASPTVAVDDTNAAHVYVAYARTTATGSNEDVFLRDSTDGGANWSAELRINTSTAAHRFMPWLCATQGQAFVSWYDQRAGVGGATPDLTDLFGAGASPNMSGTLVAGTEVRISQVSDPTCATGWPATANNTASPESCAGRQLAGGCSMTGVRCDFSDCAGGGGTGACQCAMGETCQTGRGFPKYGDYNGVACTGGRFYAAWASATSPAAITPASTDIDVFFACPPNPGVLNPSFTDTTAPVFTSVPPDLTLATCGPAAIGNATAIDPCGTGAITVVNDAPASFGLGTTTVTWTATDPSGNAANATQSVTVIDTTPPDIMCPADQVAECINNQAIVNFPNATASDTCGLQSVGCVPPPGSSFPLGSSSVSCTASDTSGNSSMCAFSVAVVDTIPPVVTTAGAGDLWPPNHKYVTKQLADCGVQINDQCQGMIALANAHPQITCVTSDEVENDGGDGNTTGDMVIVDATTVMLRSERAGGSDGRVYQIHFNVSDAAGNIGKGVCDVTVPKSQGSGGAAVDSGVHFTVGTCN
jgi:hypothetical protein